MNRYKLIKIFTLLLAIQFHLELNAQGNTTLVEGHHLAGINVTSGKSGTIPLKYAVFIPGVGHHNSIPGHNASYNEGDAVIDGIMSEAALAIDWWVLFGEPAEQYLFTWKARDYYQIVLPDSGGGTRVHPINTSMLNKYPDLLVRFEALKPTEIEFEIEWTLGDTDFFYATENTFGDIYGTRNKFKTKVLSSNILIETSGKTSFSVPGIRQGKGEEFLGLDKDFPKDKLKLIMQQFAKSKSHNILDVKVTKIKWPVGEMKAIAELYDKYENGDADPSPIQIINEELKKSQNLTTYNNDDFWGEAFEEETIKIYADRYPGNDYTSSRKIKIGKASVDNAEPRVGYMQLVLNKNVDWHKVDYDNNLFDFIIDKDAKTLQSVYGIIAKKYKKILTQVNIPGTGSYNSKREFRVYDYTGNILYRESSPRNSSTRSDYILLANTPYVLISWLGFLGGYDSPKFIEGATLLNLINLQKIAIPKFSNKASDLIPLIYDKNDLIKDWDSGTKRFIESIRSEINTYKVVIIIPRWGEQPGKSYYEHAIYGITNDDRFVHIRNNIR